MTATKHGWQFHWSIPVMFCSSLCSRLCVCVQTPTDINQFRRKCHLASLIRLFVLVMRLFCHFIWSAATDLKPLAHPRPVCFIICLFHLFLQNVGQAYWLCDWYTVQVNCFTFVHVVLHIVITAGLSIWLCLCNGRSAKHFWDNHVPCPSCWEGIITRMVMQLDWQLSSKKIKKFK